MAEPPAVRADAGQLSRELHDVISPELVPNRAWTILPGPLWRPPAFRAIEARGCALALCSRLAAQPTDFTGIPHPSPAYQHPKLFC